MRLNVGGKPPEPCSLEDPAAIEGLVAACVRAAPRLPVSAKIRAGGEHAQGVEELARAVEAGGARLLTIHCRTRREGFGEELHWERIARAVAAVSIPVCGNGGVALHQDLRRMRQETGCALVMVGHGALVDPWIFSGHGASGREAAAFLNTYARGLVEAGFSLRRTVARLKQLLHFYRAGGLFRDGVEAWLKQREPKFFLERLAELEAASPTGLDSKAS